MKWIRRSKDDYNYLQHIKGVCLVLSESYINSHYDDIVKYRNVIERRLKDEMISKEQLQKDNAINLKESIKYDNNYYLIEDEYNINLEELYD